MYSVVLLGALVIWLYWLFLAGSLGRRKAFTNLSSSSLYETKKLLPLPIKKCSVEKPAPRELYLVRFFLSSPRLVITSPRVAEEFFKSQYSSLSRHSDFGISWIIQGLLGNCLFTKSGSDWQRVLKPFKKFSPGDVSKRMTTTIETIYKHLNLITDAGELSLDGLLLTIPFEAVCKYVYGSNTSDSDIQTAFELFKLQDAITEQVFTNPLAELPGYRFLPTRLRKDIESFNSKWKEFNAAKFNDSLSGDGILPHVLSFTSLAEQELLQTLNEITLANADFVAAAVAWPLVHLRQHPTALAKVQEEINQVFGDSSTLACEMLPKFEYLNLVIKESWRLEPMLCITNPVYTTKTMHLDGYFIPAHTAVILDTKSINRHQTVWGDDADQFYPERFLRMKPHEYASALHIYGLSPRKCLGQYYATGIVTAMLAIILKNFHLEVVPDGEPNYGPFQFPACKILVKKK